MAGNVHGLQGGLIMARTFATDPANVVTDRSGNVIAGRRLRVYTSRESGAEITDLTNLQGEPFNEGLTSDTNGRYQFKVNSDQWDVVTLRASDGGMWDVASIESLRLSGQAYPIAQEAGENAQAAIDLARAMMVSVRTHGAVGNGSTNDTAAFQSAINELEAAGGGTLLVPPGRYAVNGTVELCSNITITGGGTITKTVTSPYTVFAALSRGQRGYGSSVRNVTVDGLAFEGNFASSIAVNPFALHHAQNVSILRCRFTQCIRNGHVVDLNGCDNIQIRDCVFEGFGPGSSGYYRVEAVQLDISSKGAVSADDDAGSFDGLLTRNVTIDNCQFLPLTVGGTTYPCPNPIGAHACLEEAQYRGVWFTNNLIVDPREDIATSDLATDPVKGVIHFPALRNAVFQGNHFRMTAGRSVRVFALYSMTHGVSKNFDPEVAGAGQGTIAPTLTQDVVIRDNVIDGFNGATVQEHILLRGLATAKIENITIDGNVARSGTSPLVGLKSATGTTVVNNKASGTGAAAFTVDNTVTNSLISTNIVSGYTAKVGGTPGTNVVTSGNI